MVVSSSSSGRSSKDAEPIRVDSQIGFAAAAAGAGSCVGKEYAAGTLGMTLLLVDVSTGT